MKNIFKIAFLLMCFALSNVAMGQTSQEKSDSVLLQSVAKHFQQTVTGWAIQVSPDQAKSVARKFFATGGAGNVETPDSINLKHVIYDDVNTQNKPLIYVFKFEHDSGFVMTSAITIGNPILGYDMKSVFRTPSGPNDTLEYNVWGHINQYAQQLKYAIDSNLSMPEMTEKWDRLLSGQSMNRNLNVVVPPLLTTAWDQGYPYNALCPVDAGGPGGHAWAGCVAIALSQIMKFHNYPAHGIGSYGYTQSPYGYLFANFGGTNYGWTNMPNTVSTYNADVATLVAHTGIGCKTQYGPGNSGVSYSSGSDPMRKFLWNFEGYAFDSLRYLEMQYYTAPAWANILNWELINGRVIYYRGDGTISHAWVCDGVNAAGMYHFNFGWGGSFNGYFALTAITPGGNVLTNNQHCIVGIKPDDGSTMLTNTTSSGTVTFTKSWAVPDSLTWTVTAGTHIYLGGGKEICIGGKADLNGTQNNPIVVAPIDTNYRHNGFKFINNGDLNLMGDNDTTKIIHTIIKYSGQHGVFCDTYGKVLLQYCKISHNNAGTWNGSTGQTNGYGGGVCVRIQPITIDSCDIDSNYASIQGGGVYISSTGTYVGVISRNHIHNNQAAADGGGFYSSNATYVAIKNNIIDHNKAGTGAGGAIGNGNPLVVNNEFTNNTTTGSSGKGAALYLNAAGPKIVNNRITGNSAYSAGAIGIWNASSPLLINNTISNNTTQATSSIVLTSSSVPTIKNTIMWGNSNGNGKEIYLGDAGCIPIINHCDLQGGINAIGGPGASTYPPSNYTYNKDTIPGFVIPGSDYHIVGNSTLNNFGDTTGVSNIIPLLDLDGKSRYTGKIDLGPYEYCTVPGATTIAGNTTPCAGTTQTYTATSSGATSFNWTIPTGNGWNLNSGQGTASVNVTIGTLNGIISSLPSNACGSGQSGSINVTVSLLPANAGTITGPNSVCKGVNGIVYTVPAIANATSYNWTVPTGFTIVNGANSNSITVNVEANAMNGNISVYGSNLCGIGQSSSLAVVVHYVIANAGLDQTIPYNTAATLNGDATPVGGTYTWDWQPASKINGLNTTQSVTTIPLTQVTIFTLTVTDSYTCSDIDTIQINISGGPLSDTATATPDNICLGGSSQLNAYPAGGNGPPYTYSWTSNPPGFVSDLPNPQVTPSVTTIYIVVVSDGVSSVTDSVQVTVNYIPIVPNMPNGQDTVHWNITPNTVYTTDAVPGAISYYWTLIPVNAGTLSQGNTNSVTVTWSGWVGDSKLYVQAGNGCGISDSSAAKNIHVDFFTSIDEVEIETINIYPNPCEDRLHIASSNEISKLFIYDICGRLVESKPNLNSKAITLDCSQFKTGLYLAHVYMGSKRTIHKIIVK